MSGRRAKQLRKHALRYFENNPNLPFDKKLKYRDPRFRKVYRMVKQFFMEGTLHA